MNDPSRVGVRPGSRREFLALLAVTTASAVSAPTECPATPAAEPGPPYTPEDTYPFFSSAAPDTVRDAGESDAPGRPP